MNAAALATAHDVQSLCKSSLEMIRVTCRLANVFITRSRAIEEVSGCWGWSIIGTTTTELAKHLAAFHIASVRTLS